MERCLLLVLLLVPLLSCMQVRLFGCCAFFARAVREFNFLFSSSLYTLLFGRRFTFLFNTLDSTVLPKLIPRVSVRLVVLKIAKIERCENGSWFNHVLEWWEAAKVDPEHVLFLHYEAMLSEPEAHIRIVAEFAGVDHTPEIVAEVRLLWTSDEGAFIPLCT